MTINDPLFVAAEVAYRHETLSGSNRAASAHHHGRRWVSHLHLRLPHRHARHVRPA